MYYILTSLLACVDNNESCEHWKTQNQCEENPHYMYANCKKSCDVCHFSCDLPKQTIYPGYLSDLTKNITSSELKTKILNKTPMLLHIENFLKKGESETLINLCESKFTRSLAGEGVNVARTSEQCWCQQPSCTQHPVLKQIEERVSKLLNIPYSFAEFMQILRYSPGQYYKVHHDQNCEHDSHQGARLLTFFMYLNDVEDNAGGETVFPQLNISVKPKKNSAILWNSIRDSSPKTDEPLTHHEAKPVLKGYKYAANLWFHTGEFRTLSKLGCDLKHITNYNPMKNEL